MTPTKESKIISKKLKSVIDHDSVAFTSSQDSSTFYLHVHKLQGVEKPKYDLIFLHGALAHAEREKPFFEWLIKEFKGDVRILAPDFVGHGVSSGPRAYIQHFDKYVEDFFQVLNFKYNSAEDVPFFVMGHSMGALIAIKASFEFQKRWSQEPIGFIFSNPCIKPHQVVDFPGALEVLEKMANSIPLLRLPRVHKGEDLLFDTKEANKFDTDHLIPHFMTTKMAYEIIKASLSVRAMPYFYHHRCLFLLSDHDVVVDTSITDLFLRAIDKKWVKVQRYPYTRHELLHELVKEKVWLDIFQWQKKMIKELQ